MEGEAGPSSRDSNEKIRARRKKHLKKCKEIVNDKNPERYEYLMRIAGMVDSVKNDPYEMEVMAGNVLGEINGREILYCKIRDVSKLLENLLPFSNNEDYSSFVTNFTSDLRPVFTDQFASHVLQRVTTETFKRYAQAPLNTKDENLYECYLETVTKISKFALNNLDTFVWESGSNHAIRTIFNVLNGYAVKEEISNNDTKYAIPTEFKSLLQQFSQNIIKLPRFHELCNNTLTSGLLQTLIKSSEEEEAIYKHLIWKIIKEELRELPDFEDTQSGPLIRLIEAILGVANEKQLKKLHKRFFLHKLKELAASKAGNFAVQKLIKNCKVQKLFENIFDELQKDAGAILKAKNTGVLYELANGCERFKTKQGEFVTMMMRILKCQKTLNMNSEITPLCCSMVTSSKYNPENVRVNLHGSLIVQTMLKFQKPIKIINSLLNMETKCLIKVISDPRGCHIVDAFYQSPHVGEKSRERLMKKLSGFYVELATSKYGSRSLDTIWSGSTTKNKIPLMEELKLNDTELTTNEFGKFFARRSNLYYFCRNRDEWIKRSRTLENTKMCLSDVIMPKRPKLDP